MTLNITPEKRLGYLVEIARDYAQKGFVQDVLDMTAQARVLDASPATVLELKTIEQQALWNGAYKNVLLWPSKINRDVGKSAEQYGFDKRLFGAGMVAVARDYESMFDRTILGGLGLNGDPIDGVLMGNQVVTISDLEKIIAHERKKAIQTTRAKGFFRYTADVLVRKEGWIAATQGAVHVLHEYSRNRALIPPESEKFVEAAVSVNYSRKISATVAEMEKLAGKPRSPEIQRNLVRIQTLAPKVTHSAAGIDVRGQIERLERLIDAN